MGGGAMADQWYTNKELYEMQLELSRELQETRALIKEYNSLRKMLNDVAIDVTRMKAAGAERYKVSKAIRDWVGWVVSAVLFGKVIGWY